jgi:hypothetical protein
MNIFVEHESVSDMLPDMTIPDDTETYRDVTKKILLYLFSNMYGDSCCDV